MAEWLLENQIPIFNYNAGLKEPLNCLLPQWWWVIIAVVKAVTDYVNPVFVKLQGKTLLISQQTAILSQLADELTIMAGIDGPFNDDQIKELAAGFNTTYGRWSITHENVFLFINDQGIFIRNTFKELSSEDQDNVVNHVGKLLVTMVEGIHDIQAERDSCNHAADDLSPVLPHELVKL